MERNQITVTIKRDLLKAGFPVTSCKWATGTARWWIDLHFNLDWRELQDKWDAIAAIVYGVKRDDNFTMHSRY